MAAVQLLVLTAGLIWTGPVVTGMNTATTAMSSWIMVLPTAPTPMVHGNTTVHPNTAEHMPVLIVEKDPMSTKVTQPPTSMPPTATRSTVSPSIAPPAALMWVIPPMQAIL